MSALICGSMAYDTIMVFNDRFKNHILPDKVNMLNVSFLVPELRREFGGCAGNIAYNLKMLGGEPLPMATVGQDFELYRDWLLEHDISVDHIRTINNTFTAQAFITTDMDDNQITAFHPGAMSSAHINTVDMAEETTIGIVAPDGRGAMIQHAAQFAEAKIPFIFDPGQGMPMFDGDDLKQFVEQATWVAVNEYEAQLLEDRTGMSPHEIAEHVEALIVTRGGNGSLVYTDGHRMEIPAAPVEVIKDPTGCGDAYRAGLLYGLMNTLGWEKTARVASLCGAYKIEHHGTQKHKFTLEEFKERFKKSFDMAF